MNLQPAKIDFNADGTPVAAQFDDVYFSNANGLQESRYVFLGHNQLPQRWDSHPNSSFVIAETGFGTGLNFLASWQAFAQWQQQQQVNTPLCMHFISCEKYPLEVDDLRAALGQWTELTDYSDALLAQYPDLVPGCHRLVFAQGQVILDLWFGDAVEVFSSLHNHPQGLVDAWYLDGFAPSKNPQMWSAPLFAQLARLSKVDATVATFTCAGVVKRGLKENGFAISKVAGFGRKREMLTGRFSDGSVARQTGRYFYRHPLAPSAPKLRVAIIGAGLAAANLAYSLAQRQFDITVFNDAQDVASGASGSPQGGFYPQLNAQFNQASELQALSFGFAKRRYQALIEQGFNFAHQWCGVLQLAFNPNVTQRQQAMRDQQIWPSSLITFVDATHASQIAGVEIDSPAAYLPQGGWLSPPQLVQALFTAAQQLSQCHIYHNVQVASITPSQHKWRIGAAPEFDAVIVAMGSDSPSLLQQSGLPLRRVRGQVESIASTPELAKLATVLCHKGYLTPALEGTHTLGSTYVKEDLNRDYRLSEQQDNLAMHHHALPQRQWAQSIQGQGQGRAAIRCSSPDHQPIVGALFDKQQQARQYADLYKALPLSKYPVAEDLPGLYVLTALGSRGLTSAPLAAEILASQLCGQPMPMSDRGLAALNPNRFLIRELIRRQG